MRIYINLLIFLIISCSASQTFQTAQKPKTEVEQRYQMKTSRRSARKVPKTAEDYCELAEAQYKKISEADNEKAIQFYQRAIALKPNYALAYAGLGCAYARKYMDYEFRRDPVWKEKAQEAAQEAAKLEPNSVQTHKALGLVYLCSPCSPTPSAYGDDEWTKAIDEFSLTIDLSPEDSEAYNLRGLTYQLSGKTDAAINDLQHSLSLMPENSEAHKYLGDAYSDMGLYEKVQREYRKAVELNPSGYAFAVNAPAQFPPFDIAMLQQELIENPDDSWLRYWLGGAYIKQRKVAEGIKELKIAIQLKPDVAGEHYMLGQVYERQNRIQAAVVEFEQAVAIRYDHLNSHYELATLYLNHDMSDVAVEHFTEFVQEYPDKVIGHTILGSAYINTRQYDKAIDEMKKAVELSPDDSNAHVHLGMAYRAKGMRTEAIAEFQEALRLSPDNSRAQLELERMNK